ETGSEVAPSDYAVPVSAKERAEEGMEPAAGKQKAASGQGRPPAPVPAAAWRTGEGSREYSPSQQKPERTRIGKPEMTAPAPGEILRHGRWQFLALGAGAALVSGVVMKLTGVRGLKAIMKLRGRHA